MELWVSVAKGEYDGDLGSDTQQSGEERALGKGLRAVIEKSRWSDSNRRPLTYKARALPLSYIGTRTVYHRWSRCAEGWMAARNKGQGSTPWTGSSLKVYPFLPVLRWKPSQMSLDSGEQDLLA